jgi:hypothetical protein
MNCNTRTAGRLEWSSTVSTSWYNAGITGSDIFLDFMGEFGMNLDGFVVDFSGIDILEDKILLAIIVRSDSREKESHVFEGGRHA